MDYNFNPAPYINHSLNKRLGYKIPRSILLPPYLSSNTYFQEFTDALDAVYETTIDEKIDILENIRNMWPSNPPLEEKVLNSKILDTTDWSQPERSLLVKQVNILGARLQTAGIVSNQSYQNISRYLGEYSRQKGTYNFVQFFNFCLSSNLTSVLLWTQDYKKFVPAGDSSIGTPIWLGGLWYPTTHVTISASAGDLADISLLELTNFFYEIANYNLILNNIDIASSLEIVDTLGSTSAKVVVMGALLNPIIVMSNVYRYGANAVPTQVTNGVIPTSYLKMGSTVIDFTTAYILGKPTAWISDLTGKKLPVYSNNAQIPTLDSFIGSNILADLPASNYNMLYGPVTWITVPGSSGSTARIPAFGSGTSTVTNISNVSTRMVGQDRSSILTNPVGFTQIQPGLFTPYW